PCDHLCQRTAGSSQPHDLSFLSRIPDPTFARSTGLSPKWTPKKRRKDNVSCLLTRRTRLVPAENRESRSSSSRVLKSKTAVIIKISDRTRSPISCRIRKSNPKLFQRSREEKKNETLKKILGCPPSAPIRHHRLCCHFRTGTSKIRRNGPECLS